MNKLIIRGFLGGDPEVRYMPSGDPVVNFSVATTERWKDRDSGETKEHTEWHRCAMFGKRAETIGEYFSKGSQILLVGRLRTEKWTDRENIERTTVKVIVDDFEFVDRRGDSGDRGDDRRTERSERSGRSDGDRDKERRDREQYGEPRQSELRPADAKRDDARRPTQQRDGKKGSFDDMEDDIPF